MSDAAQGKLTVPVPSIVGLFAGGLLLPVLLTFYLVVLRPCVDGKAAAEGAAAQGAFVRTFFRGPESLDDWTQRWPRLHAYLDSDVFSVTHYDKSPGEDLVDLRYLQGTPDIRFLTVEPALREGEQLQALSGLHCLYGLSLNGPALTDESLANLSRLTSVGDLSLSNGEITDDGLARLSSLEMLTELDLRGNPIEHGLTHLNLSRLKRLTMADTAISDRSMAALIGSPKLGYLDISGTAVSDAAMSSLGRLTNLRTLHLPGTAVSDAGIKQLESCRQLRYVDARRTNVTVYGAIILSARLPHVFVRYEDDHWVAGDLAVRPDTTAP